ncbi:MAG: hypothetical protein IJ236_08915 [Oscillospiraceae bacterium]|nr:hypothetical protein [Oscillospiraceae bacterium]
MKKTLLTAAVLLAMLSAGCSGNTASSVAETEPTEALEVTTAQTTEEVTEPPTNAAFPEADANAVTFDEDAVTADIAFPFVDDDTAADGTMSIADVDGNKMLKFTDETTTEDNLATAVQKLRFDVSKLLAPEQLTEVNSIEFDLYVEAKADLFENEDGEFVCVPGWIGGGGGSEMADGKWFGFKDFSASGVQEYVLERSDAVHVNFLFTFASSGKKWEDTMTEPYFQVMRWGMGNISDLYIDNITFYDADGNSIAPTLSEGWAASGDEAADDAEEAPEEAEAAEEAAPEEAPEEETEAETDAETTEAETTEAE